MIRSRSSALVLSVVALLWLLGAMSVDGGTGALAAAGPAASPLGTDRGSTAGAAAGAIGASQAGRLSAGQQHVCLVVSDGTVRCWGRNDFGGLGNGTLLPSTSPTRVFGLTGVSAVEAGGVQTCALRTDGTVRCWGRDVYGELGDGGTTNSPIPVTVTGLTGAVAISAGVRHSCAVRGDGSVWCWGDNEAGELGNNSTTNSSTPVQVSGITGAVAVSGGFYHTCALVADGTVRCWGRNDGGQLGNNSQVNASTPVVAQGLTSVKAITSLNYGTCALRVDGTVWCWGDDSYGELGFTGPLGLVPAPVPGLTGIRQISGGAFHVCALRSSGSVACWGLGSNGELGQTITSSPTPLTIPGLSNVSVVTAGAYSACAIPADGVVRCWGDNQYGQSGASTLLEWTAPRAVPGNLTASEVSAGGFHSCALDGAGGVRCWGANSFGQLGQGTTTPSNSSVPIAVPGLTSVIRLSAGSYHSCAIKSDGTVWCWGSNETGQLGNTTVATGAGGKSTTPVRVLGLPDPASNPAVEVSAGGDHTCAVLLTRTVACWGGNAEGQIGDGGYGPGHIVTLPSGVAGLDHIVSVSAGSSHTCAVVADGRVACWGANTLGQVGMGSFSTRETAFKYVENFVYPELQVLGGIREVVARYGYTCALDQTGQTFCWGLNEQYELGSFFPDTPNTPYARQNATPRSVSIGPSSNHGIHTCTVTFDSALSCWGSDHDGQLGFGYSGDTGSVSGGTLPNISTATQVSVGFAHTCALLRDGTARCWGLGSDGQIGSGSFATPQKTPTAVSSFKVAARALGVDAGSSHTCAVLSDASARCWGAGGSGRLGNGSTTNQSRPVTVSGLTAVSDVSAGSSHSCALLLGGTARCWGSNAYGQLGNNSTTSHSTPVSVSGLTGAIAISAGGNHSCAVLSNGTVKCWGLNTSGQLGDGTTTNRHAPVTVKTSSTGTLSGVVAISAGTSHTCALLYTGLVRCWGAGANGRLGNGSTANKPYASTYVSGVTSTTAVASRFASVSAGSAHTCARLANGTAKCWGAGGSGRLGNGSTSDHTTPVTVSGLTSVAQVSAGGAHSCALLSNGTAKCWGSNAYGQLGVNTTTSHSTPVTVSGLSGATSMSAGGNHTAASLAMGSLRAWGLNTSGQIGDGTTTNRLTPRGVSGF